MVVKILVVGLLKYDSGKTSTALSIIREAKNRGYNVGVSKPISGFDAWSQFKYVLKSMEGGVLVGEDLTLLYNEASPNEVIETVGPMVMLLAPPDPEFYSWRLSTYTAISTSTVDQVVIARTTRCLGGEHHTSHYVVEENIAHTPSAMRKALERLINKLNPEPKPVGKEFIEELFKEEVLEGVDACVERILEGYDVVVVESYNDAAAPTYASTRVDVVVAVGPGKIALYNGERYRRALSLVGEVRNPLATTTSEVLSLIKPIKTVDIEPVVNPKYSREAWAEGLLDLILELKDTVVS